MRSARLAPRWGRSAAGDGRGRPGRGGGGRSRAGAARGASGPLTRPDGGGGAAAFVGGGPPWGRPSSGAGRPSEVGPSPGAGLAGGLRRCAVGWTAPRAPGRPRGPRHAPGPVTRRAPVARRTPPSRKSTVPRRPGPRHPRTRHLAEVAAAQFRRGAVRGAGAVRDGAASGGRPEPAAGITTEASALVLHAASLRDAAGRDSRGPVGSGRGGRGGHAAVSGASRGRPPRARRRTGRRRPSWAPHGQARRRYPRIVPTTRSGLPRRVGGWHTITRRSAIVSSPRDRANGRPRRSRGEADDVRWMVTGAGGALGTDLVRLLREEGERVTALTRADLDTTDPDAVERAVAAWAGAGGPSGARGAAQRLRVHRGRSRRDRPGRGAAAHAVNTVAPGLLAEATARHGARIVHVSTDYVFDGTGPRGRTAPDGGLAGYEPTDPTGAAGVYGRTKEAGEQRVRDAERGAHHVVRTAWVYGGTGANFVRTMARLAGERETLQVVEDQYGSPTWSADLAAGLVALGRSDAAPGTLHATGGGVTTWCGLARAVFEELGADPERVHGCSTEQFPRPAPRPAWSVLSPASWAAAGLPPLRPWREALAAAVRPPPRSARTHPRRALRGSRRTPGGDPGSGPACGPRPDHFPDPVQACRRPAVTSGRLARWLRHGAGDGPARSAGCGRGLAGGRCRPGAPSSPGTDGPCGAPSGRRRRPRARLDLAPPGGIPVPAPERGRPSRTPAASAPSRGGTGRSRSRPRTTPAAPPETSRPAGRAPGRRAPPRGWPAMTAAPRSSPTRPAPTATGSPSSS